MNEMYDMSIVTHNWGVMAILGAIFINIFMLFSIKNAKRYVRAVTLFNPLAATMIGIVLFTGVVMMAAKHLDFTIQNIAMIAISLVLIYLEAKRSKKLQYLDKKDSHAFKEFRFEVLNIFLWEVFLVLCISFWMWV